MVSRFLGGPDQRWSCGGERSCGVVVKNSSGGGVNAFLVRIGIRNEGSVRGSLVVVVLFSKRRYFRVRYLHLHNVTRAFFSQCLCN